MGSTMKWLGVFAALALSACGNLPQSERAPPAEEAIGEAQEPLARDEGTRFATGDYHTAVVAADGSVWVWGLNDRGQLGDGTTTNRLTPIKVPGLSSVIAVAAGGSHTMALKADGTVWTWGENTHGQLGDSTKVDRLTPVQVNTSPQFITAIATGVHHALALSSSGVVLGWGQNAYGAIGAPTSADYTTPTYLSDNDLDEYNQITDIAAGGYHSLALTADGQVITWGSNSRGQLGRGLAVGSTVDAAAVPLASSARAIAAGNDFSLALMVDGTVRSWGSNFVGQLGNGSYTDSSTPVTVSGLGSIVSIAGGGYHGLSVRVDGVIRSWGYNGYGELGDGTTTTRNTPVAVSGVTGARYASAGALHSAAIKANGKLVTWGYNGVGSVGDGTTVNRLTPVEVFSNSAWRSVAAGGDHSLAVRPDGRVWAWGRNSAFQLGDGTDTDRKIPVLVSGITDVISVAAGEQGSFALRSDGTVWTWGYALHLVPTQVLGLTGIIGIASQDFALVALKSDGTVWEWSGDGTAVAPTAGLTNIVSIATGVSHSLALRADGVVLTWGANDDGQCGLGYFGGGWLGVHEVPISDEVLAIAAGRVSSYALTRHGILSWGDNFSGQLGDGTVTDRASPVQVLLGPYHATAISTAGGSAVAIVDDKKAVAWGANESGQLGDGTFTNRLTPVTVVGSANWTALAVGYAHVLAITAGGVVRSWGDNTYGQLGDNTLTDRTTPVNVLLF